MKGVGTLVGNFDLGVAQAFLTPKRDQKIYISNIDFYILSCAAGVLPKTP